eukprot:248722_1
MARTKQSHKIKKTQTTKILNNERTGQLLQKEHEEDVHEALLYVLQTKKIPKKQLLKMAKYGGIQNQVASTLEKVRGVDISDDNNNNYEEDINENENMKMNIKNKKMDYYDPSILANCDDETNIEIDNKLLFEEVIDLARGGLGGQYTNKLNKNKKKKFLFR